MILSIIYKEKDIQKIMLVIDFTNWNTKFQYNSGYLVVFESMNR